MNILIIGHARHGKDTVAGILCELLDMKFESSSQAAARIFLYDALKDKYGYETPEECFEDRVNHRQEWHDLICEYNTPDKARLTKEILKDSNMYVGMRSNEEFQECMNQGIFDLTIGVTNPRMPIEDKRSFNIDMEVADVEIVNDGTLEELRNKVAELAILIKEAWYS